MSYFLDIVSPSWEAIVKEMDGQYVVVLPIPQRKKYFIIKYIVHPFFAQQLGFFSIEPLLEADYKEAAALLKKSIRYVSSYRFNVDNDLHLLEQLFPSATINQTYMLDLNRPYEEIWEGYARGHKRTLKKAVLYPFKIAENNNVTPLINLLHTSEISQRLALTDQYFSTLEALFAVLLSHKVAKVFSVMDEAEDVLSSILVTVHKEEVTGLVMASSERGKAHGVATLVLDHLIKTYAGNKHRFNFGGTSKTTLHKFYEGFGSHPNKYLQLNHYFYKKIF